MTAVTAGEETTNFEQQQGLWRLRVMALYKCDFDYDSTVTLDWLVVGANC